MRCVSRPWRAAIRFELLPTSSVARQHYACSSRGMAQVRQASTRPPLLDLRAAKLGSSSAPLDWTIRDAGADECWAIIAPASEQGGAVRRELIDILSGRQRPRTSGTQHTPPHPFLDHGRSAMRAIKHVSFATQMGSASSGEFTNYSARYGAIRDQDRVTLYERLMDLLDCPVGLVAAQKLVPDPLEQTEQVGRFKYASAAQRKAALRKAQRADGVIRQMAPLLLIGDELLGRPVIALSNGQTRRARILSSLITGAELVVLEEPFSGIDTTTRMRLGELFAQLHAQRRPRFVLVLRQQDAVPDLVTHVLRVDEEGAIVSVGHRHTAEAAPSGKSQGGVGLIEANAAAGVGRGDTSAPPVVSLNGVSIVYGEKTVLDSVDLQLYPGTRLVLAGDNGSGKTTLLALLLGDHPRSFSFDADSLSLFSHARDHASNARTLLNRRIGHLSPELFNAFPRRPAAAGGLSVGEVIASGFENVFARRRYTDEQKQRVWDLLGHFGDLIKTRSPQASSEVCALSGMGFSELSHGSQAVVLFLRAVVGHPQLLVLDEPFQGMDQRQVERTRQFLDHPHLFPLGPAHEQQSDLQQRRNMAIVVVSHYESEWPTSFGSLLRLRDGQVVQRI
ncbi:predicted transporter [Moesziomyces antarcticus T-34]|uniref:Predicted transporter n=1 Tax=Pseudozyma antarctica (strain T-34) TaxID=1151754 RepID=M9MCT2_PSEA3|nr:predicted transporter [Moesziomyces antarcticus T-34]